MYVSICHYYYPNLIFIFIIFAFISFLCESWITFSMKYYCAHTTWNNQSTYNTSFDIVFAQINFIKCVVPRLCVFIVEIVLRASWVSWQQKHVFVFFVSEINLRYDIVVCLSFVDTSSFLLACLAARINNRKVSVDEIRLQRTKKILVKTFWTNLRKYMYYWVLKLYLL